MALKFQQRLLLLLLLHTCTLVRLVLVRMRGAWKTYKLHFIWSSSADTLCLLSTKENWSLFDGLFKLGPFLFKALFKPWAVILATVLSGSQHYFCRDASAHCAVSLHVKNKGHICTSTLSNCIFLSFFSFWIIFDNVCREKILTGAMLNCTWPVMIAFVA